MFLEQNTKFSKRLNKTLDYYDKSSVHNSNNKLRLPEDIFQQLNLLATNLTATVWYHIINIKMCQKKPNLS